MNPRNALGKDFGNLQIRCQASKLRVSGQVDYFTRDNLKDALEELCQNSHGKLVLDLSETNYLDPVAAAQIFHVHCRLAGERRQLEVRGAGAQPARMLRKFGMLED